MKNGFKWIIILFIVLSGALAYLSATNNLSYINKLTGVSIPEVNNLALLSSLLIVDAVMIIILFYLEYVKVKRKKLRRAEVPALEMQKPAPQQQVKKGPVKVIEFEFNKKPKVPVKEYNLGNKILKVRAELPKTPARKRKAVKKKTVSKKAKPVKSKSKASKKKAPARKSKKVARKSKKIVRKAKPKAKAKPKKAKTKASKAKSKAKPKKRKVSRDKHDRLYKKTISQLEKIKKELK